MSRGQVIVLGINGHVGHHIAKAFVAAGWEVSGMGRSNRQPVEGVRFIKGDADSVERPARGHRQHRCRRQCAEPAL